MTPHSGEPRAELEAAPPEPEPEPEVFSPSEDDTADWWKDLQGEN